jgi:hypothetical protein
MEPMDFSKLSSNDRTALIAAVIVTVTGLISVTNNWGVFMILSLLAGLAAVFVVLQPQVAPAMKLPAPKGVSLLGAGGVATVATGLTAIDWLGWIFDHLISFDTIQFVAGLVAAIVLLYAGWMAYTSERGTAAPAAPVAPATPAAPATTPPPPPPPAEPPAGES